MSTSIASPEELVLETPHLRLAAQAWGDPAGFRVMALHGWLDNAASFSRLAPLLPMLRMVALDLPGHGRSEHRPPGAQYHFVDFVPDVLAAADTLGWHSFGMLGHSLGAGIACFVAAVAPERVERLALIEGLGPRTADPDGAPPQLAESMRQLRALARKRLPVYAGLDHAARARATASGISVEAAARLATRGTCSTGDGITWRSDPRLTVRSPVYLTEAQVLAFLAHIEAPTLLIRAASGLLGEQAYLGARCARIRRLTVADVAGGHHAHLEQPAECAERLETFLAPR